MEKKHLLALLLMLDSLRMEIRATKFAADDQVRMWDQLDKSAIEAIRTLARG